MHLRSISYRTWFWRGLRASVVVGCFASTLTAWEQFEFFIQEQNRSKLNELGYHCAARREDATLLPLVNGYGTINIKSLGCTSGDFFVNMDEIKDVRSGKMTFETPFSAVYPASIAAEGLFGFLCSMFIVVVALAAVSTARWAWGVNREADKV